jgi:hypothetical protein
VIGLHYSTIRQEPAGSRSSGPESDRRAGAWALQE